MDTSDFILPPSVETQPTSRGWIMVFADGRRKLFDAGLPCFEATARHRFEAIYGPVVSLMAVTL